jgi:hypothetical protein
LNLETLAERGYRMPHQSLPWICAATARRGAILTLASLAMCSPSAAATETADSTFAASVNQTGEYADRGAEEAPSISADGRYVAFSSAADNLGEHGPTGVSEAYVKDLATGTVELVSRAGGTGGEPADEPGAGAGVENVMVSGDGRYVTFTSAASNLVSGLPPAEEPGEHPLHVYRRDLQRSETALVDRVTGPAGAILDERGARSEAISADGRQILFRDGVEDLEDPAGGHEPGTRTVYVRDLQTGTTTAVSRAEGTSGELANEASRGGAISPDGRYVAFESSATNLVPGMSSNTASQVYLRDLQTDTTTLASATPTGEPGDGSSEEPILVGGQGCQVAFSSQATNLYRYEANPVLTPEVYLANLCSPPASIALVSRADGQGGAPAGEGNSAIPVPLGASSDGRHILFSALSELTGEATNTRSHLYVRDLTTGRTTLVDRAGGAGGEPATGNPEGAALSANGCRVAFATEAGDLGEPLHRETYIRQLASCHPPSGDEQPGTSGDDNQPNKAPDGAPASTTAAAATQPIAGHGARRPAPPKIAGLKRTRLLLDLAGAGRITIEIARVRGHGHDRHWHTIRTITFTARKAGRIAIKLPDLAAGYYRITVALADGRREGRGVVRTFTVPHGRRR